jgi:hypothetical protein
MDYLNSQYSHNSLTPFRILHIHSNSARSDGWKFLIIFLCKSETHFQPLSKEQMAKFCM